MGKTIKDRLNKLAEDAPNSKWGEKIKLQRERKKHLQKISDMDCFEDEIWNSVTGNLNRL